MKQNKEMAAHIEGYRKMVQEFEDRGAARERERYQKAIDRAISHVQDGVKRLLDLLEPPKEKPQPKRAVMTGLVDTQPKKRKAVEAPQNVINCVQRVFDLTTDGAVLTLKNIRQINPTYGPRYVMAACRALVEHGKLEAVGKRSYRLAQRKENGLDEAMSTESPAR